LGRFEDYNGVRAQIKCGLLTECNDGMKSKIDPSNYWNPIYTSRKLGTIWDIKI